ncbi:YopX family protein [Lactiplantibacillus plantarum]|uniref:YopX family protein n=1 Tax=Lactiplantibacillus plantarum TaxID=1590 RepID=UPI003F53AAA4
MATMIKFRAWYMPFGKYGAMQEMVYSRASHILALAETEPEKYIPEQFTGLTDVNGKDIYEGDIVENERGEILRVSYSAIDASFVAGNCYFGSIGAGKEIRIIGNVHANPELLEEDK